jgi:hypothetical protein
MIIIDITGFSNIRIIHIAMVILYIYQIISLHLLVI